MSKALFWDFDDIIIHPNESFLCALQLALNSFEKTATELGIQHRLIRPYTPRHNGKVERIHREDQKRFYDSHSFYSLNDFAKQLAVLNRCSNDFPMRPLGWLSPSEFSVHYV